MNNKKFDEAISHLNNAISISTYSNFRRRYASKEQWEVEGPDLKMKAYAAWLLAKELIGNNRDEFEKYLELNKEELTLTKVYETMSAAIKVLDKEVETEFEKQILNLGGKMKKFNESTRWEEDELIADVDLFDDIEDIDDLDEDEQYVRETEYYDEAQTEDDDAFIDDEEEEY